MVRELWLEEPRLRVRRKPALRSRVTRVRVGPRARRVSWQRWQPARLWNPESEAEAEEFLAGSRTNRLPSDSRVPSVTLCPICVLPRSTARNAVIRSRMHERR
jgi:hypothetical protein